MNFSIRKLFCAVAFGSLVLTAVPAKAEFNLSEYPILANTALAAAFVGACWLIKKWVFDSGITIEKEQDFKDKEYQLVIGAVIQTKNDFEWSMGIPHVWGDEGVFKAGKYKVVSVGEPKWGHANKVITFSPVDSNQKMPFAVYFYQDKAQISLTPEVVSYLVS